VALQVFNDSQFGVQVDLGTEDDAFVAGGVVLSNGSVTINGTGDDHSVNVQGSVLTSGGTAIDIGSNGDNSGQRLIVGEDGYVGTSSATAAGAYLRGFDSKVDNAGIIHGAQYGLKLNGKGAGHTTIINNSGVIEGDTRAIERASATGNDQAIELRNAGTIHSAQFAYFGNTYAAVDRIINTGLIEGNVDLGGGLDVYNGAGGKIVGTVFGGTGNDSLTGGAFADIFKGGNDVDTLLGGGGDDQLKGDAGDDSVGGGAGNDTLNGGAGVDSMDGGLGNDSYTVDNFDDVVIDSGGIDQVVSLVSFNFSSIVRAKGTLEKLVLVGDDHISGNGNAVANTIVGNNTDNSLFGHGGNDVLVGNGGDDRIEGGDGNDAMNGGGGADQLYGGLGKDVMTGGALADRFVFDTAPNTSLNRDTIADFQHGIDRLQLDNASFNALGGEGALNAARFFQGAAAHDADDRLVYNKTTGILFYDADGNGAGGAIQVALLSSKPVVTAADFLVI
jgi:Ca2+-binding RTX toxin-like protein